MQFLYMRHAIMALTLVILLVFWQSVAQVLGGAVWLVLPFLAAYAMRLAPTLFAVWGGAVAVSAAALLMALVWRADGGMLGWWLMSLPVPGYVLISLASLSLFAGGMAATVRPCLHIWQGAASSHAMANTERDAGKTADKYANKHATKQADTDTASEANNHTKDQVKEANTTKSPQRPAAAAFSSLASVVAHATDAAGQPAQHTIQQTPQTAKPATPIPIVRRTAYDARLEEINPQAQLAAWASAREAAPDIAESTESAAAPPHDAAADTAARLASNAPDTHAYNPALEEITIPMHQQDGDQNINQNNTEAGDDVVHQAINSPAEQPNDAAADMAAEADTAPPPWQRGSLEPTDGEGASIGHQGGDEVALHEFDTPSADMAEMEAMDDLPVVSAALPDAPIVPAMVPDMAGDGIGDIADEAIVDAMADAATDAANHRLDDALDSSQDTAQDDTQNDALDDAIRGALTADADTAQTASDDQWMPADTMADNTTEPPATERLTESLTPAPSAIQPPELSSPSSARVPEQGHEQAREPAQPVRAKPIPPTLPKPGDTPLPPLSLLDDREQPVRGYSDEELQDLAGVLTETLGNFNIKVAVHHITPGPVVTLFEVEPAPGVKVSQIMQLTKDLARALSVLSVRVVEVIPGKPYIGIEIPNRERETVNFHHILASNAYQHYDAPLSLALGKDISGAPVVVNLAKMPHFLVAGTTGSGKSVGINSMILSLLYKSTADDVRLILIDPKMLELSTYEGIPHLLTPVITDMSKASQALKWAVAEMERRYKLMSLMGVRNILGFNDKIKQGITEGTPYKDPTYTVSAAYSHALAEEAPYLEPLPYIVVIIDEFADLIMMVGKEIEEWIARLAQKARAAGIHLILATQRPSVNVITGLIKANIPTRLAFQVSTKIDSRTILDQGGAEQLLGLGDMLYLAPGQGVPLRAHGAFVSDDEVHGVVAWITENQKPMTQIADIAEEAESAAGNSGDSEDDLYNEALRVVADTGKVSISRIQRELRIGYNRAARLVEDMEQKGVVSAPNANGQREIL